MKNQTFSGLWLVGLLLALPPCASAQVLPVNSAATLMPASSHRATAVPPRPDRGMVDPTTVNGPTATPDRLAFTTEHIDLVEVPLSRTSEVDATVPDDSKEMKNRAQIAGGQQTSGTGRRRAWVAVLFTVLALIAVALAENR